MPRFYLPPSQIVGDRFTLAGSEAHHALHVLRKKVGDTLELFDGRDRSFQAKIQSVTEQQIEGQILSTAAVTARAVEIWLFAALIKGPRWDWLVQKTCEVGVDVLIPIETARTIIHLEGKETSGKLERWNRIALEAAKQCGRGTTMDVRAPRSFSNTFKDIPESSLLLFPWEKESYLTLREACANFKGSRVCLWVGPEGGWEENEALQAQLAGARSITLGKNLLRSETACVVGAALVVQEMLISSSAMKISHD